MTRRVYLYFIATFLLGIILGGAGAYYYLWYNGRLQRRDGFNKERAVAHLQKVLNLSASQVQQINLIFDDSVKKIDDLQKQLEPQLQEIHAETRARIRQVLSAEQARKFDDYLKQIDERRKRRGTPPPPPR